MNEQEREPRIVSFDEGLVEAVPMMVKQCPKSQHCRSGDGHWGECVGPVAELEQQLSAKERELAEVQRHYEEEHDGHDMSMVQRELMQQRAEKAERELAEVRRDLKTHCEWHLREKARADAARAVVERVRAQLERMHGGQLTQTGYAVAIHGMLRDLASTPAPEARPSPKAESADGYRRSSADTASKSEQQPAAEDADPPPQPAAERAGIRHSSPLMSFDARDWAQEFYLLHRQGRIQIDEDTMRAWFANALMRGYDERQWRLEAEKREQPAAEHALVALHGELESLADSCAQNAARAALTKAYQDAADKLRAHIAAPTPSRSVPLTGELEALLRAAVEWTGCRQEDMLHLCDELEQRAEEWARSPAGRDFAKNGGSGG